MVRAFFLSIQCASNHALQIDALIDPGPIINVLMPPSTTRTPHVTMLVNGLPPLGSMAAWITTSGPDAHMQVCSSANSPEPRLNAAII